MTEQEMKIQQIPKLNTERQREREREERNVVKINPSPLSSLTK